MKKQSNIKIQPFKISVLKKSVEIVVFISIIFLMFDCNSDANKDIDATVYVAKTDSGYQIIRNKKPFFIKGTSGNSYFKKLKKAGANTIRIYDTTNLKNKLDKANSVGLAVIIDIPVPRYIVPDTIYNDEKKIESLFKSTRSFVNQYKNHPALLYWMVGNELRAPNLPSDDNFYDNYNNLIKLIKDLDKNHPVSTAVGGFDRSRLLTLYKKIKGLDLLSINIFGELSTFNSRKKLIYPLWQGPYVFSEFGVNGPWEANKNSWGAPIEQTSTKKGEQYRERYNNYIKTLDDGRFLGALTFYWGYKIERTHTWFSFFSKTGKKTQAVFEMENIWQNNNSIFTGPKINYLTINDKSNLILKVNKKVNAELLMLENKSLSEYHISWEVRPENWSYLVYANEIEPKSLNISFDTATQYKSSFVTPDEEGPYRLFVYVTDQNGYIATANVPFYVLK